jgi:hypothetical protein
VINAVNFGNSFLSNTYTDTPTAKIIVGTATPHKSSDIKNETFAIPFLLYQLNFLLIPFLFLSKKQPHLLKYFIAERECISINLVLRYDAF